MELRCGVRFITAYRLFPLGRLLYGIVVIARRFGDGDWGGTIDLSSSLGRCVSDQFLKPLFRSEMYIALSFMRRKMEL